MSLVFPLSLLAIAACTAPEQVVLEADSAAADLPADRAPAPVGAPLSVASAGANWLWIGTLVNPGAACPPGRAPFQGRKLFSRRAGGPALPEAMLQFCVYEAPPGQGGPNPVSNANKRQFQNGRLEKDLMVVAPSGDLYDMMADEYQPLFDQQAGRLPNVAGATYPAPDVRLVSLDSSPTAGPGLAAANAMGTEPHGHAMNQYIRRLICDDAGNCAANQYTQLVLDLRLDPISGAVVKDAVAGGTFGTMSALAGGVQGSYNAWKTAGAEDRLLYNLSIGWHPEYGGRATRPISSWPLGVQAVYIAMSQAACDGAVFFAAAGNRKGGTAIADIGPVLPGGWERLPMQCAPFGVAPAARTLTHAVGITDANDSDVLISRPNGRPAIVAFGDHAVVSDTAGGLTGVFTGTSVSTAVASAAAAVLWANKPALGPEQIAGSLAAAGASSTLPVSRYFCPAGGCAPVRIVDVCRTVERYCEAGAPGYTGPCARYTGPPLTCHSGLPHRASPGSLELTTFDAGAEHQILTIDAAVHNDPVCAGGATEIYGETPAIPSDPCPDFQYYEPIARPFLIPQPLGDLCPECYLEVRNGKVYIDISKGFATVTSLTLTTTTTAGTQKTYTTTAVPLTSPAVLVFANPALLAGTVDAQITTVETSYSTSSSLYLLP